MISGIYRGKGATKVMHLMIHQASIERGTKTKKRNGEIVTAYTPHLTGVKCRLYTPRVAEQVTTERGEVVTGQYNLMVGPDTDLTELDRIQTVIDREGRAVAQGPFNILSVATRYGRGAHHKELTLSTVR